MDGELCVTAFSPPCSRLVHGFPIVDVAGVPPACLLVSSPFPLPAAIPYRPAARFPAVSLTRPVVRVDERGVISCLPRLSSSFSVAVFLRALMSCEADGDDGMR